MPAAEPPGPAGPPLRRALDDVRRAVVHVRDDPASLRVARRAAIALAVPLVVLVAARRPEWTLYPTFGAFAAVYGRQPDPRPRLRTRAGAGAWLTACVTVGAALGVSPHRQWLAIPVAALVAAAGTTLAARARWVPPGALFAVFAVTACSSVPTPAVHVPLAAALAAGAAALALLPDLLRSSGVGRPPDVATAAPVPRAAVVEAALAVLVAGAVATAIGTGRPYWAMVAAVAVTTGATAAARVARGVQRVVGTLLGIVVAAAVLVAHPSDWVTVLLAVALQACGEFLVGRNYALALVFITPLALLMAELARPQGAADLLGQRVLETVLGAVCGTAVIVAAAALRRRSAR